MRPRQNSPPILQMTRDGSNVRRHEAVEILLLCYHRINMSQAALSSRARLIGSALRHTTELYCRR